MISTKPPGGTRDFLPDDVRRREYVTRVVREVYERYGFEPLETPAFEHVETLLGKYGEEGNKLIFKILRRGERESSGETDLALRYDLTVPLARVIAQYQDELPRFFKRYQIQPVWRADRPARGRFREFFQCDIDAVGSTSRVVEAELLAAVADVLARLGFEDFIIRLNHRAALTSLMEVAEVPAVQHADALVALDKLDKIGVEGVAAELSARGIASAAALRCLDLFIGPGDVDAGRASAVCDRLEHALRAHPAGLVAVSELRDIVGLLDGNAVADRIRIDPALARGLSYYTGAIMEVAVPDLAGSLGGGGRYDNLVGMFLGREVPACGFSLGLERILVVMAEREMFPARISTGSVDVVVTFLADGLRAEALGLAADLRAARVRVDVYPETGRRLDKPLRYAAGRHAPMLAIVGDDEHARGEVTLRDLQTRQQESGPRATASDWIVSRLRIAG